MTLSWNDPQLQVASDGKASRRATYRLLQSWYRETRLGAPYGEHRGKPVGSLLSKDAVAADRGLNFLSPAAATYAEERAPIVKAEGGSIETGRLFHNMLSSMPLCFSVFGELRSWPDKGLSVVKELFDPHAIEVETIECEWKPAASALGDRTAFDAAIVTRQAERKRHLVGVETKYTEPFSTKKYDRNEYAEVHTSSGWFLPGTEKDLVGSDTNQLWRNSLLAAGCEGEAYTSSAVCVLALEDDAGADQAVEGVRSAMTDPENRCRMVSLQQLADSVQGVSDDRARWAAAFRSRYLDLTPLS